MLHPRNRGSLQIEANSDRVHPFNRSTKKLAGAVGCYGRLLCFTVIDGRSAGHADAQRSDLTGIVVSCVLIDDRNGRGNRQSGSRSRNCRRAGRRRDDLIAKPHPGVGQCLSARQASTDELDNLGDSANLA